MSPGTKHNPDVAIKTVEAAKALSEPAARAGVSQLTSTFDILARQLDDEDRAKRNIQWRRPVRAGAGSGALRGGAAAPGAGVSQLTSTFDFLTRQLDDEDRANPAKHTIPWRRNVPLQYRAIDSKQENSRHLVSDF